MTISLRAVTTENFSAVTQLRVRDDQQGLVMSNLMAIALAYVAPSKIPLAVYAGETPVGLVAYERDPATGRDEVLVLMIDRAYQGRGYGRAALSALIERMLAERPDCEAIYLNYVPGNRAGERLYASLDFERTGEHWQGEIVMRKRVR